MPLPVLRLSRPARDALRLTLVLWGFGYLLVALLMTLEERASFLVGVLTNGQLLVVAVPLATAVYVVHHRTAAMRPAFRVPLLILACAIGTLIITAVDVMQLQWLGRNIFPAWRSWSEITWSRIAFCIILYGWTFGLNTTLFWALEANEKARAGELRVADAEAAHQGAKLDALRLQLNPHFLFNTLNALSSLVVTGRNQAAEEMIARLSEFLRASLTTDPRALIPLGEELATLEAYLEIEAVRFGQRMAVEIDCDPALRDAAVPSFILQPLVENAVKYAVAPSKRTVLLRIEARRNGDELTLVVEDDGPGAAAAAAGKGGTGVGLRNVTARLQTLYEARASLTIGPASADAGFRAVVRLPFQATAPAALERRPLQSVA